MPRRPDLTNDLISVEIIDGIPVIVPPMHKFTRDESREFLRVLEIVRGENLFDMVLDLSACTYVSSDGLGVTSACWHQCQGQGRGQMAVVLSYHEENDVINLFDITGLTRTIGSALQPTVKDALLYIKRFSPFAKG